MFTSTLYNGIFENTSVFDILPYIYVLDISDKYMKKFEAFIKEAPTWYSGGDSTFSTLHFSHFMSDLLSSSGGSGSGSSGGGGSSW